jgi:hypothetical protein
MPAWFSFQDGILRIDHDGPISQSEAYSIWKSLPATGAAWIERGLLFIQQYDGATPVVLGAVERGVTRCVSL